MQSISTLLVGALCCLCICSATRYPVTYYLEDYCNRNIHVSGDAIIKISRNLYLRNTYCGASLRSNQGIQLMASVRSYNMNSGYVNYGSCPFVSLQLGTKTDPYLWGQDGYCKSYSPAGQYILQEVGIFSYKASSNPSLYTPDVQLLVSEMTTKNTTGYCPYGYFDCQWMSTCVDNSLICNGYDDCAYGRDENEGCGIVLTVGVIGGIAAAVFFFFVIVVVLSVLWCRSRSVRVGYVQYN
ncbi:hypothetical protein Btru_043371 [Bulinus truncatus]|nr:hypothetical protein Btru_043371 [Bulinus truncatus]